MTKNKRQYVITLDGAWRFYAPTGAWLSDDRLAKKFASRADAIAEIKAEALYENFGENAIDIEVAK